MKFWVPKITPWVQDIVYRRTLGRLCGSLSWERLDDGYDIELTWIPYQPLLVRDDLSIKGFQVFHAYPRVGMLSTVKLGFCLARSWLRGVMRFIQDRYGEIMG